MILGDINNPHQLTDNPHIRQALEWLQHNHSRRFDKGAITLSDYITVNCEEVAMVPQQMLEAHRCHIDIHVPQSEEETMGWSPVNSLKNCLTPYDSERDVEFYGDEPQCHIHVRPGQFAIFYPEDAHAPNIGIGNHRKLCIKIVTD